jgi:hypothetical protein
MRTPKPSKTRGETFREAAAQVRGMIAYDPAVTPAQIAQFLADQAEKNDSLAAHDAGMN